MTDQRPSARPRGFVVAARTILELGAELISSDPIAIYELVKNAYDAGSKRATLRIRTVLKFSSLRNIQRRIEAAIQTRDEEDEDEAALVQQTLSEIRKLIDETAPEVARERFVAQLDETDLEGLSESLERAFNRWNQIEVIDTGDGMSAQDLQDAFLTIGTRSRLDPDASQRKFVGGKGIGRLSAMRLGDQLRVRTTKAGALTWNDLNIDWCRFSHASNETLDEVEIAPEPGPEKEDPSEQGTQLRIRGLKADWDSARVQRIAAHQFDRLFDPFANRSRYPLVIRVNNSTVAIPVFDERLLSEAQAKAKLSYFADPPRCVLEMDYIAHGKQKTIEWTETDIFGITSDEDVSLPSLRRLGDFSAHWHWFNRQRLASIDGVGNRTAVRDLVNHWANGLLMYRDGFRVNPYGAPDDDWLGIDFKALASAGYKVNRKQLIGAVNISAQENPELIDQTNREGLRNNEEKTTMVILLRKAVTEEFRNFLNAVERDAKKTTKVSTRETTAFLESVSGRVGRTFKQLSKFVPEESRGDFAFVQATFAEMQDRLATARDALTTAEREQRDLVNLAGIGLLVEIVTHELGRVTRRTLELLSSVDRAEVPRAVAATFESVQSQMVIIRRRLDLLDPLSPSGRNRREVFDLKALAEEVLVSHQAQFERFGIRFELKAGPKAGGRFDVRAVRGMIVQVLENLLDNSVFWLRQRLRANPSFAPSIVVEIDADAMEMTVTDNGPGIAPARAEDVFRAFVSSKPPGEGKGLGLYISKEIARYHGSELYLLDEPLDGTLHTFVLDIDGLQA